ncbi:MAG: hypothetical protein J1G01_06775 [Clostridiales bacterium]|nr:hypothetical protein [Clostridiales bacterium]
MKKAAKFLAIGLSAITLCSLTACGGDESSYDATVSESEWATALSFKDAVNFEMKIDERMDSTYEEEGSVENYTDLIVGTYTYTEFALRRQTEMSSSRWDFNEIDNSMRFYDGGKRIGYNRDGKRSKEKGKVGFDGEITYLSDDWEKSSEEDMTLEEWQEYMYNNKVYPEAAVFEEYYSLFTYDSSSHSYKFSEEDVEDSFVINNTTIKAAEIRFINKKVTSVKYKLYNEYDFTGSGGAFHKMTTEGTVTFSYGGYVITPPSIAENSAWNSEFNGTYYAYDSNENGEYEYNYKTYMVLSDGEVTLSRDIPATVKIDGNKITLTIDLGEGITQVFIGTIGNGVVWFNHLLGYQNGELIAEELDAREIYCKDGAKPNL